ncbi:hypothetical protein M407DRAFT_30504 [Tulasnella calospora MUT 4182]|uniref:Uncharacterized protein n=1 Tax=Tulasnella calospora MUT 4182 TaxID=1051891 RepID=A0A0C3KEJ5_9AGAM|nr:hypothetical protein M407DRAFT_30504 [Tulasnella calospora MUT 4182]
MPVSRQDGIGVEVQIKEFLPSSFPVQLHQTPQNLSHISSLTSLTTLGHGRLCSIVQGFYSHSTTVLHLVPRLASAALSVATVKGDAPDFAICCGPSILTSTSTKSQSLPPLSRGTRWHSYPGSVVTVSVSNSLDALSTNIFKAIKGSAIHPRLTLLPLNHAGSLFWTLPQSGDIVDEGHDASVQKQKIEGSKFEVLGNDLSRKTLEPVEQGIKDTGARKEGIDDVLSLLKDFFNGKERSKTVAWGTALPGGILSGEKDTDEIPLFVDGCPLTLGIENPDGVFIKIIPCKTVFDIGANGMLKVSTVEKGTSKPEPNQITNSKVYLTFLFQS